jgi:hypothetical protein
MPGKAEKRRVAPRAEVRAAADQVMVAELSRMGSGGHAEYFIMQSKTPQEAMLSF